LLLVNYSNQKETTW